MELLDVKKTIQIFERGRFPFAKSKLVSSLEQAVKIAKQIGFPVVLKVVSLKIIHKSDVGGVKTNIKNEEELKLAYGEILKNVKKKAKVKIKSLLIQKMEKGKEVIVGMKRDPQFGPVILFGLGGIFVEILKDYSLRIVPVSKKQALEMIKEIKAYPILSGARGEKPVNIEAIADVIVKTSNLSNNKSIKEIDLNPIIVNEHSAKIVDARVIKE